MSIVVVPLVMLVVAALEAREKFVQPDDDEFVRIGLPWHPARAERIVVVVEHAESTTVQRNDGFDRLKRKPEDRAGTAKVVWILGSASRIFTFVLIPHSSRRQQLPQMHPLSNLV
jgi:hypothetical protein